MCEEGPTENSPNAQIAQYKPTITEEENVLRFEIAVKDAIRVHVMETERHLHKVVKDERLGEKARPLLLNLGGKVAAVAVLHADAKGVLVLGKERLPIVDNVGVDELGRRAK